MVHVLKIYPEYFLDIESGRKTFEIRSNDRNYCQGDLLILTEFDYQKSSLTGRVLSCIVGTVYKFHEMSLVFDNVCAFSIFDVHRLK